MRLLKQNAPNAAARRIPMRLTDATTGADKTGVNATTGELRVSKNGGSYVNAGGSLVEIGNGDYDYIATQAELDTLGMLRVRLLKNGITDAVFIAQVVAVDLDDVSSMGMTRIDTSVSSRLAAADYAGSGSEGLTTLLSRLTETRASNLDRLDATVSSAVSMAQAARDRLPAALVGGKMDVALDSTERQALAVALLDLANGVESGITLRQAVRGMCAILFGNSIDTGTSSEKFRNGGAVVKTRVTVGLDVNNNRTVTLDLT